MAESSDWRKTKNHFVFTPLTSDSEASSIHQLSLSLPRAGARRAGRSLVQAEVPECGWCRQLSRLLSRLPCCVCCVLLAVPPFRCVLLFPVDCPLPAMSCLLSHLQSPMFCVLSVVLCLVSSVCRVLLVIPCLLLGAHTCPPEVVQPAPRYIIYLTGGFLLSPNARLVSGGLSGTYVF